MAHTCQRVGDDVRGHKSGQRKEEGVYERPEGTGAVDGDDSRHTDANVRCLAADAGASAEFQEDGAILIAPKQVTSAHECSYYAPVFGRTRAHN